MRITRKTKNQKGFTLIEVVVALFIFALLMSSVAGVFANTFAGYQAARASQRDTENAQYAINTLAKELRTSSIAASSAVSVRFYDYSQDACFSYQIMNGSLWVASATPSPIPAMAADKLTWCQRAALGALRTVTTGTVSGSFSVTASTTAPVSVGKVTISLRIAEGTKHEARIETSVSLRDYSYTGI